MASFVGEELEGIDGCYLPPFFLQKPTAEI